MARLGISIYPDKSNLDEDIRYLSIAAKHKFNRVFMNFLTVDNEMMLEQFKKIIKYANGMEMEVIADIGPRVFKSLNIDYRDLKIFKDMGLAGIRLDMGFSGNEESIMSYNPYGLKIELNISSGTKYLENIMSYMPNKDNIIGCHNFYPHRFTGISRKHFMKTTEEFKKHGLRTAAFVSSNEASFGPWELNEGLPTMEEHRNLPIEVQAKDLINTGLIDDIIISNCYASEKEISNLALASGEILELNIEMYNDLPEIERSILFDELHFSRGDVSEYMIRSTQSRVKYKGYDFRLINPKRLEKGDIVIESSLYAHYAGEVYIVLKPMENSQRSSVVGKVIDEEIFLLDYIKPWQKFKLKEYKSC